MAEHTISTLQNFVDGRFVPAISGRTLEDIEPAKGTLLHHIARSGSQDVEQAVQSARCAWEGPWSRWDTEARAALCDRIAQRMEERLEELALAESRDTGKPIQLTRNLDIPRAIANFRFFAGAIRHDTTHSHHQAEALHYTRRRPIGLVALITPWNLPLYLLTWKVAPALAMGNVIIAKPSEMTPWTATLLAEIIEEVGLPKGVFQLLHGLGTEVGQALIEHPQVQAISFTGGTLTGAKVAAAAAPHFKKLSLELGGKNPTLIFEDCDLATTIQGACRAGFANQGQICLAGSRILVQRSIFDAVRDGLLHTLHSMQIGDPLDPQTKLGALISAEHRAKIEHYVQIAQDHGATVHCGGHRPTLSAPFDQGFFYTPTLISGLPQNSPLIQEEIFGPVVTLQAFDDEADAIGMANDIRYGLSATVWTRDLQRAHRVSAALECGMVWVNTWLQRDLRTPFGGFKASGIGREGGSHSLDFFGELQNITIALDHPTPSEQTGALASFGQRTLPPQATPLTRSRS